MRMILGIALAIMAAMPAAATDSPRVHLTDDTDARWVDFTLTPGNQIRIAMRINGQSAYAVIDTGVSVSVVSTGFAHRAGLKIAATSNADAIGGAITIGWAATRDISLGGLNRRGGRIAVAALSQSATGGDVPIDALIGADMLSCCALDIDYDARRLRLLPSGRLPFRGDSAPLALSQESGVYLSELTLGGRRVRPVMIDTGDGAAVTVTRAAWDAGALAGRPLTSAVAFGLGGTIEMKLAIVPQLRIASLNARNVEVRIEEHSGFSAQTGVAGRIGSGLLQRYRVLLDPRAGHIVFRAGAHVDEAPVRSTSGLLVGLDRDRLRVLHVMANSPAAKAGWRDGDTICRVDGMPVAAGASGNVDTNWAAGPPGEVVKLGMCDGSRRLLTLARFY
ncbi:aspartyl protease family protein [Stakelama sp. CBK3Z-3]|uniref:Aspartyl protease family protein n=1 Tax=Stakelama flava TaxID=2860338 RepID=A0ABS6XPG5_9SPHN|nr:aspartyl protease family protein [Stakelama flava]